LSVWTSAAAVEGVARRHGREAAFKRGLTEAAIVDHAGSGRTLTSKKPRIIVEINDNTGFCPSFLSESN
jgi:hypothetical protein